MFGIAVLIIMVTQLDFKEVYEGLQIAGYWFFAVIALWFFLYILNTASWYTIIHHSQKTGEKRDKQVEFWWLYKITVSGFALNYATPGGLMGGEPYRIMSLSPKIGTARASIENVTIPMLCFIIALTAFCSLAIWFFIKGYKRGITVNCMQVLSRFPMIKKWANPFFEKHSEQLKNIDRQIAILHNQNRKAFVIAVLLELMCRIISALEIYFILLVLSPKANYLESILILAFTSLIANMLFFLPLQLGGREGGFLMSAKGLALTANAGIFVALIVRLRELIWTAIGLMLIKLDRKKEN